MPAYPGAPPEAYGSPPPGTEPAGMMAEAGELTVQLTIKQQLMPDPNHMYVLQYHPSAFYSDKLNVQLTRNGLLQAIITAEPEDSVLGAGGSSYGQYAVPQYPTAYTPVASPPPYSPYPQGSPGTPTAPPAETDALLVGPPLQLVLQTGQLVLAAPLREQLKQDLALLSAKHVFTFTPDTPEVDWEVRNAHPTHGRLKLRLGASKVIQKRARSGAQTAKPSPQESKDTEEEADDDSDGVKIKIAQAYEVSFTLLYTVPEAREAVELGHLRTRALMANESEVYTLPFDRYMLVQASFANTFHNGQLTHAEVKKPSFPQNVVAVPLEVMSAFLDMLRGIGSVGARAFLGSTTGTGLGVPLLTTGAGATAYPSTPSTYSTPSYSTPSYSTPPYSTPSYSAPTYGSPSYSSPSYLP